VNQTGDRAPVTRNESSAKVLSDGTSPECEQICTSSPSCTGYSTDGETCFTLRDRTFFPSLADGTNGSRCFWRHTFLRNSTDAYPEGKKVDIPQILWSYWQVMPSAPQVTSEFIELCKASWKKQNPDWEVRLLDEHTWKDWLSAADLPHNFDDLMIQHKSDVIRLALLNKYGGVWLDATSITIKSMDDLLGNRTDRQRLFFNLNAPIPNVDRRVDWRSYVGNWFLAAPPKDPLMEQTTNCVWKFFALPAEKRKSFATTGMFTVPQLQMLQRLGIWEYVSTTACLFKSIAEDAGIADWYFSDKVQHIDPVAKIGTWWFSQLDMARLELFHRQNQSLAHQLEHDVPIFKVTAPMRNSLITPLSPKDLWCQDSTFHSLITSIGIENHVLCDEKRED